MEYEYYRDIIKDISLAILMFIHNKKINVEDCVVATLLDLELKKYIKIENERVIILKDISELLSFEQLVLQRNNYDEKTFKKLFIESLMSQLVKQRYINKKAKKYDISEDHHIEKMKDKSNIAYFMELPIAWMVIYMLSIFALITGANLVVAVFMIVAYITAFLCIPIYNFIQNRIIVIIRTEKALELAAKIKGIKNYIVDYSNIKNSGIEMVKLYEEFVIYAIILDIKGNLNNECKELYENIKNKVVIKELK